MFGIGQGYLALAAVLALLGAFIAGDLTGAKHERAAWEASTAKLKADAATLLANAQEAARKKENEDAEKARAIDATYQDKINILASGASDRERSLLGSLRNFQRRGDSCINTRLAEAAAPGSPEVTTPDPRDAVLEAAARDFRQLGDDADKLAAWATACHNWATENGR